METLNSILNFVFDTALRPFHGLNPAIGLMAISVITGILMLLVFRHTSDQKGIKRAKNLVKAHFLAIRLYKDDFSQMLSTMKNILVSNGLYMSKSVRPMLFMLIPVGLILIQLDSRYEHRPFRVGESAIVTVRASATAAQPAGDLQALSRLSLVVPSEITVETQALRIAERGEVCWRIRMEKAGAFDLQIQSGDRQYDKRIYVSDDLIALSPEKQRTGFVAALFNPAETAIPANTPLESIVVTCPKRALSLGGVEFQWLLGFFVMSLVAGFSLKGVFKVEI